MWFQCTVGAEDADGLLESSLLSLLLLPLSLESPLLLLLLLESPLLPLDDELLSLLPLDDAGDCVESEEGDSETGRIVGDDDGGVLAPGPGLRPLDSVGDSDCSSEGGTTGDWLGIWDGSNVWEQVGNAEGSSLGPTDL